MLVLGCLNLEIHDIASCCSLCSARRFYKAHLQVGSCVKYMVRQGPDMYAHIRLHIAPYPNTQDMVSKVEDIVVFDIMLDRHS